LRRRAQLDLAAGFDGDASAPREIADAAQHWREIDGSHATAAVATVIREPFQLEPDPRLVGGRMNGPITDEVQSVARGQAPRRRRHDGLPMPEVCRHPTEVADGCQPHVVAAAHSRGPLHHGLLRFGRRGQAASRTSDRVVRRNYLRVTKTNPYSDVFAMNAATTCASSGPRSSWRKWPPPSMVVCGRPCVPGIRSFKTRSAPPVIGS
jgi:hypothetical protein